MLTNVMRKADPKDIYPLLFSPDVIWKKWMNILENWSSGKLMNSRGEITNQSTDLRAINANLLRPLQGLTNEELDLLLENILSGSVVFQKADNVVFSSQVLTLSASCKTIKNRRYMSKAIEDYLSDEYGISSGWKDISSRFDFTDVYLDDLCNQCPSWLDTASCRAKKTDDLPDIVRINVKNKCDLIEHRLPNPIVEPWFVFYVGHHFSILEAGFEINIKMQISLAVLDATTDVTSEWKVDEFLKFFHKVQESTSKSQYAIVVFVHSGVDAQNCFSAMNGISGNIHVQWGTYKYLKCLESDCQSLSVDLVLACLISTDIKQPYPMTKLQVNGFHLFFEESIVKKHVMTFTKDSDEDAKILRAKKLKKHAILNDIPKFNHGGHPGGALHPHVKSPHVFDTLVSLFTGNINFLLFYL